MSPYNVLGLGQPLVDNLVRLSDEHLFRLGIAEKGGSQLIRSQQDFEDLLARVRRLREEHKRHMNIQSANPSPANASGQQHMTAAIVANAVAAAGLGGGETGSDDEVESPLRMATPYADDEEEEEKQELKRKNNYLKPVLIPGGSCVNTIKGLAALGEKVAVIGKAGKDEMGTFYKNTLRERGVIPLLTEAPNSRTGEVMCLITPDGQRTMRAFLGASEEMHESDLLPQDFQNIKLLHVEGYSIYNQPLTLRAMQLAKRYNALVSFDLGSFELVRNFKPLIIDILRNYVDIVFCNEEEALELLGQEGHDQVMSPGGQHERAEQCVDYLATLSHVAVVMMGAKGCWVKSKADKYRCPTKPVEAIDTTGAGDCFASGFLFGYLQGYSLEQCARLGSLAGGAVVQVVGAEIPPHMWKELKTRVNADQFLKKSQGSEPGDNRGGSAQGHKAQLYSSLGSSGYGAPSTTDYLPAESSSDAASSSYSHNAAPRSASIAIPKRR